MRFARLAGLGALLSALTLAAPLAAQTIPETDCDRLAGFQHTPRAADIATVYRITAPDAAVVACEAAVAAHPDEPFFAVLLAAAYLAADPTDVRGLTLVAGAAASLPALATGRVGMVFLLGQAGLPVDEGQARASFEQACALRPDPHAAVSCNNLAMLLIEGQGGDAEPDRGITLLTEGCDGGLGMSCVNLGYYVELGRHIDFDIERAGDLYQRACDLGDVMGCNNLGFLLEAGQELSQDIPRALALYAQACEGGETLGCSNLAEAYRLGTGVQADAQRAADLFQTACTGADPYACFALAGMLAAGEGIPVDAARALALYDQACDLGDPDSCELAAQLR